MGLGAALLNLSESCTACGIHIAWLDNQVPVECAINAHLLYQHSAQDPAWLDVSQTSSHEQPKAWQTGSAADLSQLINAGQEEATP